MKIAFFYSWMFFMMNISTPVNAEADCIKLSQDMLYAARTGESTAAYKQALASFSFDHLLQQLDTDEKRIAFWLNIYNAFTQTGLTENPDWYKSRNKFYKRKFIRIAGKDLSLDLVEHGILRRSKIKLSMGYLNKCFPSRAEKKLRVDKLDNRIHFALNCGAKSCPPIAFYKPEQLDKQLELATKAYLKGEVVFNQEKNTIALPKIFSWFRGDFGGKKGIIKYLQQKNIVPADVKPGIKWKEYDWTLALKNYEEF
jgi:hypothetical protein